MNLAVVGSRSFSDYPRLCAVLGSAKTPITCIVSGGAAGADSLAQRWADEHGVPVKLFLPDYASHGKRAPLVRNRLIMQAADNAVAFWDGVSTGTVHAIKQAAELGKPVKVIKF